jgi:hypothetical protein
MTPPFSPEVQSFGREVRRLLRHPLVRSAETEYLRQVTKMYMKRCMQTTRRPAFIKRDILKLVRSTQRLVDRGISPPPTFHSRYARMLEHAFDILMGYFVGRVPPFYPDAECCICLCRRGGNWWLSPRCGHCFHTKCISALLWHDYHCPLCRIEFYWP